MFLGFAKALNNFKQSLPKDQIIIRTVVDTVKNIVEVHTSKMIYSINFQNLKNNYGGEKL